MKGSHTMDNDIFEYDVYTLTDEEGNESEFRLLSTTEYEGAKYCALAPIDKDGNDIGDEYVILRAEKDEDGEECLVSIEDDDEFDAVADIFDDEFADIDYDGESEN